MTDAAAAETSAGTADGKAGWVDPALVAELVGRVRTAGPREMQASRAPFSGEVLASVPVCSDEDVAAAFARAREAQRSWAARPVAERAQVARRLVDLVLDRREEGLDLVQAEAGKARVHALEEVLDIAMVARYYSNTAADVLEPQGRQGALVGLTSVSVGHNPKGVVGVISPWNYPLTLAVTDPLPALLAGNAVVLKPDSQSPLTALWGARLLEEAGLPEGVLQVVTGPGRTVGTGIIDRADYLCFTGSTNTGRTVAKRAGERLVGCSLELGGKNALLVLADADLDKAVEGTVRSSFSSAGQLCVSMERLLVHRSLHDAYVARLAERMSTITLSAQRDYATEMGSLVSQDQLDTVSRHVQDAVDKGATVLAGGKHRPDIGPLFYEPTLLGGVTSDMACYAEETFGPVVYVSAFDDEDEAVERHNATAYGLNASIWTRDTRRGRALGRRLKAGTVNVNEGYTAAWASVDAPMGGVGDSGMARRHGREGILKYTEPQTVAIQRVLPLGPSGLLTPSRYAALMPAAVRLLAKLPFIR